VLVVAPLEARLKRVMESLGIDEESAKQEIANFDDSRREFARRYFKADLEDPIHYDLIINTGGITVREASAIITHACETCEKARETKKEQSESSATV
jgi:cytidylate kinase